MEMSPTPVSSFTRNLVGFAVFLSVSFGVTIAVNMLTANQTKDEQVAAAAAKMLEPVNK